MSASCALWLFSMKTTSVSDSRSEQRDALDNQSSIEYVLEARRLNSEPSSTENTFYPAVQILISVILTENRLPFQVRVNTSEAKGKTRDMPDFVLCDDKMFVGVFGEVKRSDVALEDLAFRPTRTTRSAAISLKPASL